MAKDPAFLFYPNDYLGGTMGMTFEQKGAYMDLLMLQFNRGHMTKHMMGQVVGHLLDELLVKFEIDDEGLYFNRRLEEEQKKRKIFVDSRLNNISGANQYTKKSGHMDGHTSSRMENTNKDEIIITELGSAKVKEIANEVWKDQIWKEQICMGLSIKVDELQKWLAMFNSSIASDKIPNFDKSSYKKMSRGWINAQRQKGVTVETAAGKTSNAPKLSKLS